MTLDEFLAWDPPDRSVRSWQLINGEPNAILLCGRSHGAIQAELGALLRNHLLERGLPGRVALRPGIVPRALADRNYRIPDIGLTFAPPSRSLVLPDPALLIEILDVRDEPEAWANVWTYLTIPSVTEVLVVESAIVEAKLIRRDADGVWPEEAEVLEPGDTIRLEGIGFTVSLRSIYRTTVLGTS
jgi:Uma2 family endonuclease